MSISTAPRCSVPTEAQIWTVDPARYRQVLGQYATGVVAVCAIGSDGAPVGMAVNSFTSVSLEPPLVSACVAHTSSTWPGIEQSGAFCANILAAGQVAVSRRFATRDADRFAGVAWRPAASGSPIIYGAIGWVDCTIEDRIDVGDHTIVIGRVVSLGTGGEDGPLLYYQGRYGQLAGARPAH